MYGSRKPSLVESEDKLEDAVDKLPVDLYSAHRGELDQFFQNLPFHQEADTGGSAAPTRTTLVRTAVNTSAVFLAAASSERVACRIVNPPPALESSPPFVLVARSPSWFSPCDIVSGFSRVFLKDAEPYTYVNLSNPLETEGVEIPALTELALVRWKS